jgi:pyruvate,water dikinase
MWNTRPYPLDVTTFTGAVEQAIGKFLATIIGRSAPNPDDMFLEEDGIIIKFTPPEVHPSPSILFMPWIALWRTRHYDPARWEADPLVAELVAAARALEGRDLRTCTWQQNLETLRDALALVPRAMELRERYFLQALVGLAGLALLLALAGRRDRFEPLTSGVRTKTTEINQILEDLAKQIRSDPALRDLFEQTEANKLYAALQASGPGQGFRKQFEAFLDQYGHRETSLTVSQPAWKDQPEIVLGILKVLADTELRSAERYADWTRARAELLTGSILGARLLRGAFLESLTRARSFFQLREDTHFYLTLSQPTLRRVCLELGRRLVQVGALEAEEEVFHLRREELETLGQPWPPSEQAIARLRELVVRRNARRASLANVPMIDPRLLAVTSRASTGEDILLQGTSGSPGVARGPARIVQDVSEFGKLKAGDVLVAPVTNPAWTPLFQRAAAVVVDTGGAASHAAIVAREYGIPAVMGTANGTRELKDGDWIEVDGSRGLVRKAEEQKGVPHVV